MIRPLLAATATLALALPALAQEGSIKDNSFLLEEAYNQEGGVVQHIGVLQHLEAGAGWAFTFTQEWPLWGQRNQLSYTIPVLDGERTTGLGDVGIHYRYQVAGGGDEWLALAPRLSMFFPTGKDREGNGAGSVGLQAGLPASVTLGSHFVTHLNTSVTLTPSSRNPAGNAATAFDFIGGGSLVWLAAPTMNFLVEAVYARTDEVLGEGRTRGHDEVLLNPGVRFAFNLPGGRQVVPGLSYTFGVGPSAGSNSAVLVYLSFEHPFSDGGLTGSSAARKFSRSPARSIQ
ncbi:MAG: transporter [Gemmatimonadales bacterium]